MDNLPMLKWNAAILNLTDDSGSHELYCTGLTDSQREHIERAIQRAYLLGSDAKAREIHRAVTPPRREW